VGQAHPQAGHCGGGIRKNPRLVRTHRPGSVIEQVYERQESGNSSKTTQL